MANGAKYMAYIAGRPSPITDDQLVDVGELFDAGAFASRNLSNRLSIADELELDYDMGGLKTVATFETLQLARGDEAQQLEAAASLLAAILTGWNLTSGGQPVECNRATIEQRGLRVMVYFLVHLKPYFNESGTGRASVTAGIIVNVLVNHFQPKGY